MGRRKPYGGGAGGLSICSRNPPLYMQTQPYLLSHGCHLSPLGRAKKTGTRTRPDIDHRTGQRPPISIVQYRIGLNRTKCFCTGPNRTGPDQIAHHTAPTISRATGHRARIAAEVVAQYTGCCGRCKVKVSGHGADRAIALEYVVTARRFYLECAVDKK